MEDTGMRDPKAEEQHQDMGMGPWRGHRDTEGLGHRGRFPHPRPSPARDRPRPGPGSAPCSIRARAASRDRLRSSGTSRSGTSRVLPAAAAASSLWSRLRAAAESSPELTGPSLAPPQPRGRPYRFVLRDPEQRGLCLRGGRLVPLPLQGASAQQEEPLSAVPNPHLQRRRCPLLVGIRGGSRALACSPGPEPRLQLLDVGLLELISREESAAPCTFYKSFGGSTHTFEAAASPGAFLSTGGGHELGLAPPDGATAFYLHRI
uniref:Uncharacterized protein n=1 Tax=Melopsittacus undulatus TaxID=13146 RepID=A0A8V5H0L1_MELUD